jgi:hypothetical protein
VGIDKGAIDKRKGSDLPEEESWEGSSAATCFLAGNEDSSNTTWRER